MGALVGVPVALVAYFFLKWVGRRPALRVHHLPADLGFERRACRVAHPSARSIRGLLVGLTIKHLPGTAGDEPVPGFQDHQDRRRPSTCQASSSRSSPPLGPVVLGPEAPLRDPQRHGRPAILLPKKRSAPSRPRRRPRPRRAPPPSAPSSARRWPAPSGRWKRPGWVGRCWASGRSSPGLPAAGVGSLIFIGLNQLTGFGTFPPSVPDIPTFTTPTVGEFAWAIGIGLAAAILGTAIKRLALWLQSFVYGAAHHDHPGDGAGDRHLRPSSSLRQRDGAPNEVLFSGQSALPALIENAAGWTVVPSSCSDHL